MVEFKQCPACGANPGGNRKYCDKPECKRAAAAARKARSRAKVKGEPSPAPKVAQRGPEGPQMSYAAREAIRLMGECPDCFGAPAYGDPSCVHLGAA